MGGRVLQEELPDAHSHVAQGQVGVEAHLEEMKADGHHAEATDALLSTSPAFSLTHYQLALAA